MNPFVQPASLAFFHLNAASGEGVIGPLTWLMRAYWCVFQTLIQIGLGMLILYLVHSFTGGDWGVKLKPTIERALRLFPQSLILFIPVALLARALFPWASDAYQQSVHESHNSFRIFTLSPLWFVVRSYCYLSIWTLFALRLRRRERSRLERGVMLLILLHSVSWAGMEWIMTLDPDWTSTGFGVMYIIACLNAGLGTGLVIRLWGSQSQGLDPKLLIDYGNLLLMSGLLWIYMNFMQYIVIWSAQQPEEMHWYQTRGVGIWPALIGVILLFHFVIPFPLLLTRIFKVYPRVIWVLALFFSLTQMLETLLWVMA